jgi:ABC-2 type transport system ATP-binding protein
MIELRGVQKSFGSLRAVDGISFRSEPGEIFGLLGPNGAGKSTTIKMIMNILAPDGGEILFQGRRMQEGDKDAIGYLPEERGLYRKLPVQDTLLYFASLKNADPAAARRSVDGWLERFELSDWKKRKCEELSKGMAQKVQFIAAVAHDPSFIFLDEPFAGLDPISMDVMRDAVLDLGTRGKTILFSTHNMEVAERLCSRILIMDHGREVVSGSLAEIKGCYGTNTAVVEFDGELDAARLAPLTAAVSRYPRWVEIQLAPGASPRQLLSAVLEQVSVRRFEMVSPSLHRIFVEKLGGREGTDNE